MNKEDELHVVIYKPCTIEKIIGWHLNRGMLISFDNYFPRF
jgi:hypothetical protein